MFLANLQNLTLNILKETKHNAVQNIEVTELPSCKIYNKKILTVNFESFTILPYGHAENSELRNENAKVKAINAKLKQALEEHETRFMNLEQRDKEKTNLIAKIEQSDKEKTDLIAKLEYDVSLIKKQSLQDKDMALISKEVLVSSEINSINNHKQIVPQKSKFSEDKANDDFLDLKEKERVSNKIRQHNRERKLKCGSTIQDISSDLFYVIETINDQDPKLLHNQNLESFTKSQPISNGSDLLKQSSTEQNTNLQKIKAFEIDIQPLIQELLLEYSEKDCIRIVNVKEDLVIDQSPAIKLYQYRKYFEKRLDDILSENQRNNKRVNDLASGQIYDEMLQYLSACEEAKKTLPETEISEKTKEISIKNHAYQTNAK
ncbi:8641_t:CDS:2, partial [Cetraspora pellucida]